MISNTLNNLKHFWNDFSLSERLVAFLIIYISLYQISCLCIYYYFQTPLYYNWTELYISYEGGLVRRGLLGSLLSLIAGSQYFSVIIIFSYAMIYLLWYIFVATQLFSVFKKSWCLVLLGAPAAFAFFYQSSGAFIRKDIFIEIAFAMLFLIYYKLQERYKASLFFTIIIYVPAFLIHELTLLFIWLPYLYIIGIYRRKRERIFITLFFSLIAISSLCFAFLFAGTQEQGFKITSFWNDFYPGLIDTNDTAIKYLGMSLLDKPLHSTLLPYLQNKVFFSIIKGIILAFLPIIIVFVTYRFNKTHLHLFGRIKTYIFYTIIALTASCIIFIMNDIGRILSLLSIYFIFYLVFVLKLYKLKFNNTIEEKFTFSLDKPLALIITIAYMFSWSIFPWVPVKNYSYLSMQIWQNHFIYGIPKFKHFLVYPAKMEQY